MPNYRLVLCYDGSRYNGWQRQGNTKNTIQEKLEAALSGILGQPVEAAASGRTDAGVHARAQTVSFRAKTALGAQDILKALREDLPEDIGAVSLEEAEPRFHARLSCRKKTYLYRIWTSESPCVFERKYTLVRREKLDIAAMREAAQLLSGRHDLAAFCTGRPKKSTVRTVESIEIRETVTGLELYFTGDGFLYNTVRILTGTLLEVGAGRMSAGSMPDILASRERQNAGPTAPARGLFLWETFY